MMQRTLALSVTLFVSTAPAHAQCWLQHVVAGPVDASLSNAVASAPGRLVVGQPRRNPYGQSFVRDRVRIFEGAPGALVEVATFESSLPLQTNASFGTALDLDGDWLAVGDPAAVDLSATAIGAVHLYERTTSGWVLRDVLSQPAAGIQYGGSFGVALDLDGDTLVVGSPGATVTTVLPVFETGAVFVFERTSTGWQPQQTISATTPSMMAGFGSAVALDGNDLAVGASGESLGVAPPFTREGAVHLLRRTPGSPFVPLVTLQAAVPVHDAAFGSAVSLESGVLVVGAPGTDSGSLWNVGAVHVFESSPVGAWLETAVLGEPPLRGSERFGESVLAQSGDLYITSSGLACAWRFTRAAGVWTRAQRYTTEAGVAWPMQMPVGLDVSGGVVALSDPRGATLFPSVMSAFAETGCAPVPIPSSIPAPVYLDVRSEIRLSAPTLEFSIIGGSTVGTGLLFYGFAPTSVPLGTGLRCVDGPLARVIAGGANPFGTGFSLHVDLQSFPISTGPLAIAPGTPTHFQYWFRKTTGSTHLTNSLVLTFCP